MRDSLWNVRSSGLGGVLKDINRTGKLVRRVHKERQERKEKEQIALEKAYKKQEREARKQLKARQSNLQATYKSKLAKTNKGTKRSSAFKMSSDRPYTLSVKGTVHKTMKNYKVPVAKKVTKAKYNKWGDRIA